MSVITGIGIDVVQNDRIRDSIQRFGDRFLSRIYTEGEIEYCKKCAQPEIHYAARFAAKEAAFKALSGNDLARGVGWREIEVLSGTHGPELVFHGLAEQRAKELGIQRIHVSLTHTHLAAVAMVVLEA